jgi:hypothetical protein
LAPSNAKVSSLNKIKIKQKTSEKLAPSNAKVSSLIKMKIKQRNSKNLRKNGIFILGRIAGQQPGRWEKGFQIVVNVLYFLNRKQNKTQLNKTQKNWMENY